MRRDQPQVMRWIAIALLTVALAGCTADDDAASEASLAFDSDGEARDGTHAEAARCSDGAQLSGAASVDQGAVVVTVRDGDGAEIFSTTYAEEADLEGELLDGDAGDWTVEAERVGNFEGDYSFVLLCT